MKPVEPRKNAPPRNPVHAPAAPVAALERPQGLKKWAADLIKIVKTEESTLFEGWDFGPGALTRVDFTRILKKMSGCGSVVELRAALDRATGEVGAPVVHAANYCGQHTICPYCAGRVQDRRGARFRESILEMGRRYPHAYMLTATIPPVPTWREDLDKLISGWQSLRRMGQVRRRKKKDGSIVQKRGAGEWGKVCAGLAKVELKRGSGSGLPHCHYHALVFTETEIDYRVWNPAEKNLPKEERTPRYRLPVRLERFRWTVRTSAYGLRALKPWTPGSKLTAEWYKATDGATNFRVDKLKYRPSDRAAGRSMEESIFDQSREVLKYATKFDSAPEAGTEALFARDFVGIRDATYSRRLFATYGDFRHVGGNDFEGGGPHISDNPLIYESRWRGVEYSPLVRRSRPVFLNTDKTPAVSARLVILNRAQGQVRRMRSAVLGSKRHYRECGELRPAFYAKREYAEDGSFRENLMAIEPPTYLVDAPADPASWERWTDEVMEQGRAYYANMRERLDLISLEDMDGTIEEQTAFRAIGRRGWIRSDENAARTVRLFIRTINESRELINGPP